MVSKFKNSKIYSTTPSIRTKMSIRRTVKKLLSKSPTIDNTLRTLDFELKRKQDFSKLDSKERDLLLEIQKNGYVILPDFYDKEFCNPHRKAERRPFLPELR